MSKFIDAEEITPIMAKYVADVFSRKEHLDDISYGYCMEIADVFRRYAERAEQEQPKKSQKSCNDCPHCVDRKDQFGWHFKGCFGGPYKGKFIAEIDGCPLQQEQPSLPDNLYEAARHVYESWMGGTMDEVRRDMVELGKALTMPEEKPSLAVEDIKKIVNIADGLLDDPKVRMAIQNHSEEEYYQKVLDEYNRLHQTAEE